MSFKLYAIPNFFRTQKIQIAAKYAGCEVEIPPFDFSKDRQTEDFGKLTPLRKIPVLQTPDGGIFESNAIVRYLGRLAGGGFMGSNAYENAKVDQWMDFAMNEIDPPRSTWYMNINGYVPLNPKAVEDARKNIETALNALNIYLLQHTYLASNVVTAADIVVFASVAPVLSIYLGKVSAAKYPNLLRWFNTILRLPHVSSIFTDYKFAVEDAQLPKPAKKEEKPKEETKPKEDDEDKPAPKPKNPLDSLPESPMVLDTIKKLAFSERPILSDFFERLWPQFDANGYCCYTCTYNYNNDNKVYFMTGNAVGGFLQRSDACRKYAMGVMNIAGKDEDDHGPYKISGAWIFRGPKLIDEMTQENPDSEYYTWTKLDPNSEADRAIIKEQFMATHLGGEAVLDRRYFK